MDLAWKDGKTTRRLTLTPSKGKPSIYNPLPALATALAWARELGPGVLPGDDLPILPERLAPAPPPYSITNTADVDVTDSARGIPPGRVLSIGAAWMLAHQVFGSHAGCMPTQEFTGGRFAPRGEVGIAGGEAAALSLLACPDIGWAPEADEVMQALSDGEGTICGYTTSASELGAPRENQGSEVRAACDELVTAGLCKRSADGGRLKLHPKVGTWLCMACFCVMGTVGVG